MKKLFTIIIALFSVVACSQHGIGWQYQKYKANFLDSVNFQTSVNFNRSFSINKVPLTTNIQELNILDGALINVQELNYLVGTNNPIQQQINAKANTDSPTFTGNVFLPSTTTIGSVTSTEISYLRWLRRNIQAQFDDTTTLDLRLNTQVGSYTLGLLDNHGMVLFTSSNDVTLSIPLNSSVAFPNGAVIRFVALGTGRVSVVGMTGVNILSANNYTNLGVRYSPAMLIKVAENSWLLSGDLSAPPPSTLLNGLVAYWGFNETSGTTAYDATSNDNDLTITGATINQTGCGDGGRSYLFDGTNDYVGNVDNFKFTSAFSISMMIRTTVTTGYQSPIGNYHWTGQGYDFIRNERTGRIEFTIRNSGSGTAYTRSTTNVANGSWHHVVATWDGSNIRIYINGTQEAVTSCTFAPNYHASNRFVIGTREIGDNYWNGGIDNVAIYSRALTSTEVSQLTTKYGNPY